MAFDTKTGNYMIKDIEDLFREVPRLFVLHPIFLIH